MATLLEEFVSNLQESYATFLSNFPEHIQVLINLVFLVLLITAFAFFIWKFYKFISRKNIIKLNLSQYNFYKYPLMIKLFAGVAYFIEYIVILPFLIFFWFIIFAVFLAVLAENQPLSTILLIAAAVVCSIRVTSYYDEELSQELAKVLPFTLLAVALFTPNIISFDKILGYIGQASEFSFNVFWYLAFIAVVELVLRIINFIFSLMGIEEDED